MCKCSHGEAVVVTSTVQGWWWWWWWTQAGRSCFVSECRTDVDGKLYVENVLQSGGELLTLVMHLLPGGLLRGVCCRVTESHRVFVFSLCSGYLPSIVTFTALLFLFHQYSSLPSFIFLLSTPTIPFLSLSLSLSLSHLPSHHPLPIFHPLPSSPFVDWWSESRPASRA